MASLLTEMPNVLDGREVWFTHLLLLGFDPAANEEKFRIHFTRFVHWIMCNIETKWGNYRGGGSATSSGHSKFVCTVVGLVYRLVLAAGCLRGMQLSCFRTAVPFLHLCI